MGKVITDWAELKKALDAEKAAGKKIVFTNGCFDILHAGHVRLLSEARGLGDVLLVALNSDRSVEAIKPGRPMVAQEQRAEVLSALAVVDYVTFFEEPTPYEIIKYLAPDVLVKGGDWKPEDIIGSDLVVETHSLPYIEGFSTTEIIRKARNIPQDAL